MNPVFRRVRNRGQVGSVHGHDAVAGHVDRDGALSSEEGR